MRSLGWMNDDDVSCRMVDWRNTLSLISSRDQCLSGIVTIINLQHTANRIWICAEFEIRVCWIKLCWSNNHYTAASQKRPFQYIFKYFFNLFYSTTPFLYPQKHKKPYVFWCFQGVLKINIGLKWVNFFSLQLRLHVSVCQDSKMSLFGPTLFIGWSILE